MIDPVDQRHIDGLHEASLGPPVRLPPEYEAELDQARALIEAAPAYSTVEPSWFQRLRAWFKRGRAKRIAEQTQKADAWVAAIEEWSAGVIRRVDDFERLVAETSQRTCQDQPEQTPLSEAPLQPRKQRGGDHG